MRALTTLLGAGCGLLGGAIGFGIIDDHLDDKGKRGSAPVAIACLGGGALAGALLGYARPRRSWRRGR